MQFTSLTLKKNQLDCGSTCVFTDITTHIKAVEQFSIKIKSSDELKRVVGEQAYHTQHVPKTVKDRVPELGSPRKCDGVMYKLNTAKKYKIGCAKWYYFQLGFENYLQWPDHNTHLLLPTIGIVNNNDKHRSTNDIYLKVDTCDPKPFSGPFVFVQTFNQDNIRLLETMGPLTQQKDMFDMWCSEQHMPTEWDDKFKQQQQPCSQGAYLSAKLPILSPKERISIYNAILPMLWNKSTALRLENVDKEARVQGVFVRAHRVDLVSDN
jgi:hypothetical protein